MECNKDEASRAKKIAVEKLLKNDFEGARKIAVRAKQLCPELDNISQLITVCDIHCSAQKKIFGAEKDLYGILQVENVADETTIRKQYRKLALVLHPDKNKFPGAEAAFKLIGEANMILSDKGKRSVYDIKCREPARASVTKLQNRQGNQSVYDQNKLNPSSQSNGMNHHQQSTSNPGVRLSFWTYCPFCNVKYEYYRDFVNRPLRCQHCLKLFIAYDIGAQGAGLGPVSTPEKMQKVNLGSNKVKVSMQKNAQFPSDFAHPKTSSAGVRSAQRTKTEETEIAGGSRSRTKNDAGVTKPKDNMQKPMETGAPKVDVDSSGDHVDCRKSSRKRQEVSYQEDGRDGVSPQKRSRWSKSSSDDADMDNDDGSMPNGKHKVKVEGVTIDDEPETDSDPVLVDCPDQEFTNFDQNKEEHCFAVDQIWACYDSVDGMPRFYAQIKKIYSSSGFRLRFTWLEAEPENDLENKWAEEGLPVACGKFVRGETEETRDRLMFSHQIVYKKGGSRFSYFIYPQKGEIWALFKDWDIKWSLNPENHKKYKFDIVEILSVHDTFVSVAFLLKVKGFRSVFQRTIWAGLAEHMIPLNEIFRFSHHIPSAKLTGTEKPGVPMGSFELDMASLPGDLEEYYCTNEVNNKGSQSRDEKVKVKPATNLESTPKKHINNSFDNEMFKLRRSPRGLKGGDKANDGQNPSNLSHSSHDFSLDKQICKFQVGQIWAFWERDNGIRQSYAKIKQIEEFHPVKLHVSLLKLCTITPQNYAHNLCGVFKVSSGKPKILPPDSFSHIVKAEACGKNMFNIYPKEQQIWALRKKQDGEYTSELGEYEIIEVLETDEVSIKVMSLTRVPGFKSIFKAPKIQRSTEDILVIPRVELKRFFYQIPAFHFTEEKDGCLRGCWELDPAALTGLPLLG